MNQAVDNSDKREHVQKHEILRFETNMQMAVMEGMGFVHKPTAAENEQAMSLEEASQAVDRWIRWGLSEQFRTLFINSFEMIRKNIAGTISGKNEFISKYDLNEQTLKTMREQEKTLVEQFSNELLRVVALKQQEEISSPS